MAHCFILLFARHFLQFFPPATWITTIPFEKFNTYSYWMSSIELLLLYDFISLFPTPTGPDWNKLSRTSDLPWHKITVLTSPTNQAQKQRELLPLRWFFFVPQFYCYIKFITSPYLLLMGFLPSDQLGICGLILAVLDMEKFRNYCCQSPTNIILQTDCVSVLLEMIHWVFLHVVSFLSISSEHKSP